jgi:hypothetical protein
MARIPLVAAALGSLLGPIPCYGISVAPISIRARGIDGTPGIFTTEVTRIERQGECEYRLELKDPSTIDRPIGEVSGNRGPAQRIMVPCSPEPVAPPAFDATPEDNPARFEEQTAYYWMKKARDYAQKYLWITPPNWTGPSPKYSNAQVSPAVLSQQRFDVLAGEGFSTACWPRDPGACMRAWHIQNPRIYFKAGQISARLVAHEYGHYAAGFVFGHMDPFGIDGMEIARCVHRSFQEGIAEVFKRLFLHKELTTANPAAPAPADTRGLNTQWVNLCLETNEYRMSDPLWEAFEQSVWAAGMDAAGTNINVPWANPDEANAAMANAFTYALATVHGFRTHRLAFTAVDYIRSTQTAAVADAVRAIFASHGLVPARVKVPCIENDECSSGYCDRGDGTSKTSLCMPAAGTGVLGDVCTHDNQCASRYCGNLFADSSGNWTPGLCTAKAALGSACSSDSNCTSTYCDAGPNTAGTNLCMPRGGAGATGDPCTHDTQCASANCANLTRRADNTWIPGQCAVKAGLGDRCSTNGNCASSYCDAGFNTGQTNLCMPRGGAGSNNDPCTHNTQCSSGLCADLLRRPDGSWIPGHCALPGALGLPCLNNAECASGYCDRGFNTGNTNKCMPRGGTGGIGAPCSHNNQCGSGICKNLVRDNNGNWVPGQCL